MRYPTVALMTIILASGTIVANGLRGAGPEPETNDRATDREALAEGTISIISSFPPDGYIDPRDPGGGQGMDEITLTFDGGTSGLTTLDFSITVTDGTAPTIVGLAPSGNDITLSLDGPIPSWAWTTFTHNASGTSTRIGFLPGDCNGSGRTNGIDALRFFDGVFGCWDPPFPELPLEFFLDINGSGTINPLDFTRWRQGVLGLIGPRPWYDETLPE
ncbi:MAG: hypothetical protein V3W34_15410 [Phycisphaerae bacterium]